MGKREFQIMQPGRRLLFFPLVFCLCLSVLLGGCLQDEQDTATDLARAEEAQRNHDYDDAEMYIERYLRKNPEHPNRWLIWNNLLDITLHIRQDRRSAREYLEIMLVEFEDQPEQRRTIQLRLAAVSNELRLYDRAVVLWEQLVEDKGLDNEDRAKVYRSLAKAYLRRLEFTIATDTLEQCLTLNISAASKASCRYDLAEAQMLTDELPAAEKTLTWLLANPETPENLRVLAIFMLADVSEQLGKFKEAKELFESILEAYPNQKVVELRLAYLNNRKK